MSSPTNRGLVPDSGYAEYVRGAGASVSNDADKKKSLSSSGKAMFAEALSAPKETSMIPEFQGGTLGLVVLPKVPSPVHSQKASSKSSTSDASNLSTTPTSPWLNTKQRALSSEGQNKQGIPPPPLIGEGGIPAIDLTASVSFPAITSSTSNSSNVNPSTTSPSADSDPGSKQKSNKSSAKAIPKKQKDTKGDKAQKNMFQALMGSSLSSDDGVSDKMRQMSLSKKEEEGSSLDAINEAQHEQEEEDGGWSKVENRKKASKKGKNLQTNDAFATESESSSIASSSAKVEVGSTSRPNSSIGFHDNYDDESDGSDYGFRSERSGYAHKNFDDDVDGSIDDLYYENLRTVSRNSGAGGRKKSNQFKATQQRMYAMSKRNDQRKGA